MELNAATLATATRDTVILHLVTTEGLSINAATKKYVELRKEHGLQVGVVSKKADAYALLAQEPSDELDPRYWVDRLQTELDVSEGAARDYLKSYALEHGLTVKRGAQSEEVLDWIVERAPAADESDAEWAKFDEAFLRYWLGKGRSRANLNEYRKGLVLHRKLLAR